MLVLKKNNSTIFRRFRRAFVFGISVFELYFTESSVIIVLFFQSCILLSRVLLLVFMVGVVAQWLGLQSLAGGLSLIYA